MGVPLTLCLTPNERNTANGYLSKKKFTNLISTSYKIFAMAYIMLVQNGQRDVTRIILW